MDWPLVNIPHPVLLFLGLDSGIQLRITLLAAGFVIGPSGASIRDVCRATGADIRSWTTVGDGRCRRPTRTFRVEGLPPAVRAAATIVADAVERYKDLCEGGYAGQSVCRIQRVHGVEFAYQPPPRSQVPNAATLKGPASRRNRDRQQQGSLARRDGEEGANEGPNRGAGGGAATGVAAAGAAASSSSESSTMLSRSMVLGHLAAMLPPEQPSGLLQAPTLPMGFAAPLLTTALSQLLSSSVSSPVDESTRYLEALALLTAQQKTSSFGDWGSNASSSYSLATSPLDVASMLMAPDAGLCGATSALAAPSELGSLATSMYAQQLIALQLLGQATNGLPTSDAPNMIPQRACPPTTATGFVAPGFDATTTGGWAPLGGASASPPGWLA